MRPLARFLCALIAGLAVACSSDPVASTSIQHPTLVEVAPEDFLGSLPCTSEAGGVQRYVATLTDVTPDEDGGAGRNFVLPSSPPLPCTQAVGFSFVVGGRKYVASVDAYDRADITAASPGLRQMVDPNGQPVLPRWTSECDSPVTAVGLRTQRTRGCRALVDRAPSGSTAVRVTLESALADLECGSEAGQVATYSVELEYLSPGMTGSTRTADCGEDLLFDELVASEPVRLLVSAFEADALEPSWGTTCVATTAPLVTVGATCEPLGTAGAVEIDVPALLAALGQSCSDGVSIRAELPAPVSRTVELAPPACEQSLQASPIEVGDLPADRLLIVPIEVFAADGACSAAANCTAKIVPGRLARANCEPRAECEGNGG